MTPSQPNQSANQSASQYEKTFEVVLYVYTDESGMEQVLPDKRALDYERYLIEREEERVKAEEDQVKLDPDNQNRAALVRYMRSELEKRRWTFEDVQKAITQLQPDCEERRYTLKIPTYGQYIKAEGLAREVIDHNGVPEVTFDQTKIRDALFPISVGRDPDAFSAEVGLMLANKVKEAATPSLDRMRFLSWQHSSSRARTGPGA